MPVGKYKSFGACVGAQRRMGKSKSVAEKICGEIEKRTKEAEKKKK